MAAAEICITRESDADGFAMAASGDGVLADAYQYANVSRDKMSDDEQQDMLASTAMDTHDTPDSAPPVPAQPPPPSPREQRQREHQQQHHHRVGAGVMSTVVDPVG
jgi:hypothetical protein